MMCRRAADGRMVNVKGWVFEMAGIQRIGILGLGLIGGSLAKAFRMKAGIRDIAAMDFDRKTGKDALADGVITDFSHPEDGFSIFEGCDLLILGTPVETLSDFLPALSGLSVGIVSDVASVKSPVMSRELPDNFIGGHPMAGSERRGYGCSREDLFENAIYVLCVGENCAVPVARLVSFEALIGKIGAKPIRMDAKTHDNCVAAVSHLPHIAASALCSLASERDDGKLSLLAAGGFRDITRIASSDPDLWAGITESSAEFLVPILGEYIETLQQVKENLTGKQRKDVREFFQRGAFYREKLPLGSHGALAASSSLTVYLEDRPGAIADITVILSRHNINIRNMNIRDYRAYEGGQLLLLLGDSSQAAAAYSLLREAGYECD